MTQYHTTIDCKEFKRTDLSKRVYNTEKAFVYLTDLVNFGWRATKYSMIPIKMLVHIDKIQSVRSRKYDQNGRLVIDICVDPEVQIDQTIKNEETMRCGGCCNTHTCLTKTAGKMGYAFSLVLAHGKRFFNTLCCIQPDGNPYFNGSLARMLRLQEESASKIYLCTEGSPDGIFTNPLAFC